ncbi:LTA synthase family protein [Desulfuromonas thiophila]|uniref:LTA synthase family protein n=1 Tax=Desulfuromonas thiophila TaxID=57664 RepID=UPI0024A81280|nr:LTA synthase family protein [Desulfuromonas thiophila]
MSGKPHSKKILVPPQPYNFIFILYGVLLTGFFILRLGLTFSMWKEIPHGFTALTYIFVKGLAYDSAFLFPALLLPALPLIFKSRPLTRKKWFRFLYEGLLFASLVMFFFILAAEILFWQEFGTRFNFIAVDYLVYRREVTQNIYESYSMFLVFLYLLSTSLPSFIFLRCRLAACLEKIPKNKNNISYLFLHGVLALLLPLILSTQNLSGSNNNYVNELSANGPYQFITAFRLNILDYEKFYALGDPQNLSNLLKKQLHVNSATSELFDIHREITTAGSPQRLNVFLITVESLSAQYLTRFRSPDVPRLTPFLDQLIPEGLFFSNLFATGTRTTRGLEAITLSIPPTPGRALVKRPDCGPFFSLGQVLRQQGYDTAFLYGGRGFFDNMNTFFSRNGYRIIDEGNFLTEEIQFKNAWGVCDEDLYAKAIREADTVAAKGKPFFFHLMTTSNHRPYTYPKGKINIPSGSSREGAVRYTDYALEQLFLEARSHAWFDDTLFIIVADHCAGSAGKVGLPIARYHIPMLFYSPKHLASDEFANTASQIDLAPTLLGLLSFNYKSHFFGENLLAADYHPRALVGNYQKLGLYCDDQLILLEPRQGIKKIHHPWESEQIETASPEDPLVQIAQAYYQGADYIIRHKLNQPRSAQHVAKARPHQPKLGIKEAKKNLLIQAILQHQSKAGCFAKIF